MSVINMYKKMIEEGKLNKPIHIQQMTPDNPNGSEFGSEFGSKNIDNLYKNEDVETPPLNEINKLKNRIDFLEKSVKNIMDMQIKILKR